MNDCNGCGKDTQDVKPDRRELITHLSYNFRNVMLKKMLINGVAEKWFHFQT